MIKVGEVYRAEGDIDIRPLPLKVKLKLLVSHTIETSAFLSGDFNKFESLIEEASVVKTDKYIEAISAYLSDERYEDESEIYIIFPAEDKELIQAAIGHPQFSIYHRQFLTFNRDLQELQAFLDGVLLLRRIL